MTHNEGLVEREQLAISNIANFVKFCARRLAPHMLEDLEIVVRLAGEAIGPLVSGEEEQGLGDCADAHRRHSSETEPVSRLRPSGECQLSRGDGK
jgi:hypothetical protein